MSSNFHGFDVKITGIESTLGQVRKLAYFTVDGESKSDEGHPFEYVYNPDNVNDSFLVEFPNDFLNIPCPDKTMNCVDRQFYKLVKYYELINSLTPKTQQTFKELIDEL
jgi:hypothetical protein